MQSQDKSRKSTFSNSGRFAHLTSVTKLVLIIFIDAFLFMTTVLQDVLEIEKKSEQQIAEAEAKAAAALEEARAKQKAVLIETREKLNQEAEAALKTEGKRVAELVSRINVETTSQVAVLEQKFTEKKEELKTLIKQKFQ